MIVLSPIAGTMAAKDGGRRPTLAGVTALMLGLLVIVFGIGRPLFLLIIGLLLVNSASPPFLPEPARTAAVEAVVDDANPRAVVALIGPGKPLPDAVAERHELVDAADDAFAEGIRTALAIGVVLSVLALIAGAKVFPKGVAEEDAEVVEAHTLASSEAVRQTPG